MKVETLIEFMDAAANSHFVATPYEDRGGIMLVGFPGSLRTTMIRSALDSHADALILSDLNVQQWLRLREEFVTGRYNTMGFVDFEKLYQRHNSTAMHIEGIIKGIVCEGYGLGPSGDSRMPTPLARATVIGAMTYACMQKKFNEWQENGFMRRFLWIIIAVSNANQINAAIKRNEKLEFGRILKMTIKPGSLTIPMNIPSKLEPLLEHMIKDQAGYNGTSWLLLRKITAVLCWKHEMNGSIDRVEEMLEEVAPSLSKKGGKLVL